MKRLVLTITATLILAAVIATPAYAWLSGYSHRKQIIVQSAYIDSNLTDFPLYVDITADTDIGGNMQDTTNYYDIRFTNASDVVLPYEEESMSISGGVATGNYWVKTNLDSSSGATLYVYYGKSGDTDGSNPTAVWSASYQAVWHMGEASWNGTAGEVVDTISTNDGVSAGNATTTASGKIGRGGTFDGTGDYVDVGTGDFEMDVSNQFTISMWIKPASGWVSGDSLIARGQYNRPFKIYMYLTDEIRTAARTEVTTNRVNTSSNEISTGFWSHIVFRYDNGTNGQRVYIDDGSADATGSLAGTLQTIVKSTYIASTPGETTEYFPGDIDEVRITNDVRTDAEIKFEYYNMNESDNELTWGGEVAAENIPADYSYYKEITVQSAYIDSNLADFPVYVDITSDSDIGGGMTDTTNYYDIRFTDSSGTLLPYEEESMSISAGVATGNYWVKTDLNSSSGATIRCYYGKSGATDGSNPGAVWSASYQGVYHMNESSWNGTTDEVKDSSPNTTNDGTAVATATTTATNAKIYRSGTFDGDSDYVNLGTDASIASGNDGTVTYWVRRTTTAGTCGPFEISLRWRNYDFDLTNNLIQTQVWDGAARVAHNFAKTIAQDTWYHVAFTFDDQYLTCYVDGALVESYYSASYPTNLVTATGYSEFGSGQSNLYYFTGQMDEFRITNDVRTAAEIKFEYYNINESDNELTWAGQVGGAADNAIFFGTNF